MIFETRILIDLNTYNVISTSSRVRDKCKHHKIKFIFKIWTVKTGASISTDVVVVDAVEELFTLLNLSIEKSGSNSSNLKNFNSIWI